MDKTYLCLGAGPGIGLCTALRFAKEGFRVVLVSRNPERQKALVEEFKLQTGETAQTLTADVGNAEQMRQLAAELPTVDVAHFNAAVLHAQTLEEADYANLHDDIQIGITGALYALKAFSPTMLEKRSGTFLLTGGMLADNPVPQYLTLGIAKAGIKNMTKALFDAFCQKNVHIATVTVSASIAPRSSEAKGVAELFWELHQQHPNEWSWEKEFKSAQ